MQRRLAHGMIVVAALSLGTARAGAADTPIPTQPAPTQPPLTQPAPTQPPLAPPAAPSQALTPSQPGTRAAVRKKVLTGHHMVVAANPDAAVAGMAVLQEGGSAIDAAVAVQMALTLAEPQASGIGGGALLLYYDARTGDVTAWDGRETAPAAAGPDLFLDRQGGPMKPEEAGVGGRAVGVPGVLRMLEAVHKAHGTLPWDRLFAPAVQLAENGVKVAPRLAEAIVLDAANLRRQPAARALFFHPDGTPLAAGSLLVNKPLADTLRAVAAGGANALLVGPIAGEIATAVRTDANPGLLTADDLAAYAPRQREPVCAPYRDHRVCGFGPPSAGGVSVLQTLDMLSHFDLLAQTTGAPVGADGVWALGPALLLIEAERLAHADRLLYLADADRVGVPVAGLLEPDYLSERAQLIDPMHAAVAPRAGNPSWNGVARPAQAPSRPQPEHGTTHVAIVDDAGNAVSMTTTVQDRFGSRLLVRGFMLNDQLTDFSELAERDGLPVANRVGPGKRPRSAMAPSFVFRSDGSLEYVVGSAGGAEIIGYVAQTLVELLDFGRTPEQAVASPHLAGGDDGAELEADTPAAALAAGLAGRGEHVSAIKLDSGTAVIRVGPDGLTGGADPRRDGVALGG